MGVRLLVQSTKEGIVPTSVDRKITTLNGLHFRRLSRHVRRWDRFFETGHASTWQRLRFIS